MSEEATNDEIEELRRRVEELRAERCSILLDYEERLYVVDELLNLAIDVAIAEAERVLNEAKTTFEDDQMPVM